MQPRSVLLSIIVSRSISHVGLFENGMNPFFIHLLNCMGQYEKWHHISPVINEEKGRPGNKFDSNQAWNMARFKKTILTMDESIKNELRRCSQHIHQEYTMVNRLSSLDEVAELEDPAKPGRFLMTPNLWIPSS